MLTMRHNLRDDIEAKIGEQLTDEEFAPFSDWFVPVQLRKRERFVAEGKVCRNIYFIQSGATHTYIIDHKGERHALQFGFEGYWIGDMFSFFTGNPAIFNVEALEPTTLLSMKHADFEIACKLVPKFERCIRILIQNGYMGALLRIAKSFSEDAEQRYLSLLEKQPALLQRVPQYLVASYLGIKPQSLSRIRQQLLEK
jgi:CRP-like cAMP-binding protein